MRFGASRCIRLKEPRRIGRQAPSGQAQTPNELGAAFRRQSTNHQGEKAGASDNSAPGLTTESIGA